LKSENKFEELRILKTFASFAFAHLSLIFKLSPVQTHKKKNTHTKNEQKQQQQKEREEGKGSSGCDEKRKNAQKETQKSRIQTREDTVKKQIRFGGLSNYDYPDRSAVAPHAQKRRKKFML
jgi:type III secretory pathway component EscV